jgi:hypothetical protein
MNKKINEFKVKNLELLEKISTLKSYLGLANISPAEALALFEANKNKKDFMKALEPFKALKVDDVVYVYDNPLARLVLIVASQKTEYLKREIIDFAHKTNDLFIQNGIGNNELIDLINDIATSVDDTLPVCWFLSADTASKKELLKNIPVIFLLWLGNQRLFAGVDWVRVEPNANKRNAINEQSRLDTHLDLTV